MSIQITGKIEIDGTWQIKARLCHNGNTYPNEMKFLIDTGAESTVICNKDAKRLNPDFAYSKLTTEEKEMGGAGSCNGRPIYKVGIVNCFF